MSNANERKITSSRAINLNYAPSPKADTQSKQKVSVQKMEYCELEILRIAALTLVYSQILKHSKYD